MLVSFHICFYMELHFSSHSSLARVRDWEAGAEKRAWITLEVEVKIDWAPLEESVECLSVKFLPTGRGNERCTVSSEWTRSLCPRTSVFSAPCVNGGGALIIFSWLRFVTTFWQPSWFRVWCGPSHSLGWKCWPGHSHAAGNSRYCLLALITSGCMSSLVWDTVSALRLRCAEVTNNPRMSEAYNIKEHLLHTLCPSWVT